MSSFFSYNHLSSHSCSFIASLDSISLPNNVHEALSHPGWHSAMVEEMQALNDNGTWNLVYDRRICVLCIKICNKVCN